MPREKLSFAWLRVSRVAVLLTVWPQSSSAAEWRWLETPHFQMLSNAPEAKARDAVLELEEFRSIFQRFSGLSPEVPQRNIVILFASEKDFAPYLPEYKGRQKKVAGYFSGSSINAFMVLALGGDEEGNKRVLYHEFVHALYREVGWQPPLWFNEGSAEVLSTFEVKRKVANIGRILPWHLALLHDESLMPLARLFAVTADSPEYNEGRKQGIFYAESWALVHFLLLSPDRAINTRFHAALLALGANPSADFAGAMGMDPTEIYSRLEAYIHDGSYHFFKEPMPGADAARVVSSRPIDAREKDCLLETVKVMATAHDAISYNLIRLEEQFPTMALPREMRASHDLQEDDEKGAEEKLWEAVNLNTSNIRTYWYLAEKLADDWLTTDIDARKQIGAETARQLRLLIGRVLAAYPDVTEMWEEWGRTEAFAPDPQPTAVEAIEKAARRYAQDPHAIKMLLWAALARQHLGNDAGAQKLAEYIDHAPEASASTRHLNRLLLSRYFASESRER